MLLRRCMQELNGANIQLLNFSNTTLSFSEVVDYLCENLGLSIDDASLNERMQRLRYALMQKDEDDLTTVLVIDDAHNLTTDTLNDLLSIANPPNIDRPLIVTIVAGPPELVGQLERLERPAHIARLTPLAEVEVGNFIAHQMQIAGYPRQDIFTPNRNEAITEYTKGNPRTINSLCDAALFIASMEDQRLISPEIIEKAARQCFLIDPERIVYEYPELPTAAEASAVNTDMGDDDTGLDNLPPSAPLISVQPGLSSTKAGDVLGLRIGDVSAELAAAGITPLAIDEDETIPQFRHPQTQTPADTSDYGSNIERTRAVATESSLDKAGQPVKRLVLAEDFAMSAQAGAADSSQQASHKIVSGLTTVGGEFQLKPRRRRSYRWLRVTLALLVFLAVLSTAIWYKPDFFNMTRAEVDGYVERIKSSAGLYTDRAKTLVNGSRNDQQQVPSPQTSTATTASTANETTERNGAMVEKTVSPAAQTPSPDAAGNQDDSAKSDSSVLPQATLDQAADTAATETGPVAPMPPVETSSDVVIVNQEKTPQQALQPLPAGARPTAPDNTAGVTTSAVAPAPTASAQEEMNHNSAAETQIATMQPAEQMPGVSEADKPAMENSSANMETPPASQMTGTTNQSPSMDSNTGVSAAATTSTTLEQQETAPSQVQDTAQDAVSNEPPATTATAGESGQAVAMAPEVATSAAADEVQTLLESARQQMSARRLTTPENDNAFATYRSVLQIDPANLEAQQGLDDIKETYINWATSALRDNEWSNAIRYYERALRIDPDDPDVQQALDQAKQSQPSQ
jgi:type II secretory pathway predicted ATPase ExeA